MAIQSTARQLINECNMHQTTIIEKLATTLDSIKQQIYDSISSLQIQEKLTEFGDTCLTSFSHVPSAYTGMINLYNNNAESGIATTSNNQGQEPLILLPVIQIGMLPSAIQAIQSIGHDNDRQQ